MHITVFGGSFNPPHSGHRLIITQVITLPQIEQVWLIPCYLHSFAKSLETPSHRLAMTNLLIASLPSQIQPKISLNSIEVDTHHSGSTYTTLLTLKKRYPEHSFSFLIGSDQLATFHRWHRFQELTRDFPSFVYPRPRFPFEPLFPNMTPLQNLEMSSLSSTSIRHRLAAGDDVSSDLPKAIRRYITKHHLYR